MSQTDPRIDAYISKSADFAQPILNHLRQLVHRASPQIKETMKWSMPFFEYKGTLCNMAAFKEHCSFGFWKGAMLADPDKILNVKEDNSMGQLGRITSLTDLPADELLIQYIHEAILLNEQDVKVPKSKPVAKTELLVPEYFTEFLKEYPQAQESFEKGSYSHKKEYVDWIVEAKTETTRQKRMQTAVEWLAEGKSKNWKYQR